MVQHEKGGVLTDYTGYGTESEILALKPGDHLCLLYDGLSEQLPVMVPFMLQGLQQGERVIYAADGRAPNGLLEELTARGVDTALAEDTGALLIWTDGLSQPQASDLEPRATRMRRAINEALLDGYSGVRIAVEMTWALGCDSDTEAQGRWETALDEALSLGPVRAICQYHQDRFPATGIESALLAHPMTVVDAQVSPNAFYRPPEVCGAPPLPTGEAHLRVDWMMGQLRRVRRFEQERRSRQEAASGAAEVRAEQARVQDLYDIANRTADSLAQANALKDEFLSLVSHELRTPLTVVLGNSDLLLRCRQLQQEERDQALQDIRNEAQRMNRLVTNLLSVARMSIDTNEHLKPVLLGPVLRRVIAQHRRSFPKREIRLTVKESEVPCVGIEALIEQVLANLVSNAEKYSTDDQPIDVSVRDGDGWRIVTVKDHGIGLDPNSINRAFEAFYRSDQASGMTPGLGIGLTVCKRLVEAQGGRIWARSREGGGAEFCFMLRQAKAEVGAARSGAPTSASVS